MVDFWHWFTFEYRVFVEFWQWWLLGIAVLLLVLGIVYAIDQVKGSLRR